MEHVDEYLLKQWRDEREEHFETFKRINAEIIKHTCTVFSNCKKYSDLVYKLEWPSEEEKQAFMQASTSGEDVKPIVLSGVVVDNQRDENTGRKYFQIVDISHFPNGDTMDTEELHYLRDFGGNKYTLWAYCKYPERAQTIGELDNVRPGTKVIMSLVDLEIAPNNAKNLRGYFTDITTGDDTEYFFIDSDYRIHRAQEYFALFDKMQLQELTERLKKITQPKGGCYIATSVYGSYDCPEVWTLRRYRDGELASTWFGRAFIRTYYAISPTLVKWFGESAWFKKFWRGKLDAMVMRLQREGIESTPYCDKDW